MQISALAHDIKTPLTVVRGNAEMLSDTEQLSLIHILPNGTLALRGDILLNPGVIPAGLALSVALFLLLLPVTANWFQRQEAK